MWAWDGHGRNTIWKVSGRSNNTVQSSSRSSDHVISLVSRQTHCGLSIWPRMCGCAPLMVMALVIAAFFRWKGLGSPILCCVYFTTQHILVFTQRNGSVSYEEHSEPCTIILERRRTAKAKHCNQANLQTQ